MTSTREILAQQAEVSRLEQEEIAARGPADTSGLPPTTTMHSRADGRTHAERINEFETAHKDAFDMLSPEQFAELKGLLEPIAEVNILMLPLIRAQVAEFDRRQVAVTDAQAKIEKPADGGNAPGDGAPTPPSDPAPAPAPGTEPPPTDKPDETV